MHKFKRDYWPDIIVSIRMRFGLCQIELADILGVSTTTLSLWENGENVSDKQKKRILEAEKNLHVAEQERKKG